MKPRILVVDDDEAVCRFVALLLEREEFEPRTVTSASAAVDALAADDFDAVLTDVAMEGGDGLTLCARVLEDRPELPVIVMTASRDFETAVGAIRAGAFDYLTKPIHQDVLGTVLRRAIAMRGRPEELDDVVAGGSDKSAIGRLHGTSQAMERLRRIVRRVATSDASVLITGESGTGKELVARALHDGGARQSGPFVAINCAAIPESLLESELFGHAAGSFTDARVARTGLLVQAAGGTVFLDEVADLPLALQPKLLRVLQERCVRPVGSNAEVPIDVRFVAATNRNLRSAVVKRQFREDLWYRLAVIEIRVPPLRARGDDILLLARHFVDRHSPPGDAARRLTPAAAGQLLTYRWPGNVRELENCIERACALAGNGRVGMQEVSIAKPGGRRQTAPDAPLLPLAEIERRHVRTVLEAVGGNAAQAARILEIDRKTLARKMRRRSRPPLESTTQM